MHASRQGDAISVTFITFDWQDTLSFLGFLIAAFFPSIHLILHHWKSSKQNYFYKSN